MQSNNAAFCCALLQAASVQIMHGGIWRTEQMGQTLRLGAREVLNESWTALAARNGRPPAFDTTCLVGAWCCGSVLYGSLEQDAAAVCQLQLLRLVESIYNISWRCC
jgi:hypothetical protein